MHNLPICVERINGPLLFELKGSRPSTEPWFCHRGGLAVVERERH